MLLVSTTAIRIVSGFKYRKSDGLSFVIISMTRIHGTFICDVGLDRAEVVK